MPYIKVNTNANLSDNQMEDIKRELGSAITLIGKSESWLMVDFEIGTNLYFKGSKDNLNAYVEVKVFGHPSREEFNSMTGAITEVLKDKASIEPDHVYVSYFETDNWGYNGGNF